jgi:hypothetical protein
LGLSPIDVIDVLCTVARFDGPINAHELSVIQQVAQRLELPPPKYKALLTTPAPTLVLRTP